MKRLVDESADGGDGSPPVRGRGLKQHLTCDNYRRTCVAPRAGAWIETIRSGRACSVWAWSPPVRGRGLKLHSDVEPGRCG